MPNPIAAQYRAAMRDAGVRCPIEAGLIGTLADNECRHGRLPGDRTTTCGCWPQENGTVIALRDDTPSQPQSVTPRAA